MTLAEQLLTQGELDAAQATLLSATVSCEAQNLRDLLVEVSRQLGDGKPRRAHTLAEAEVAWENARELALKGQSKEAREARDVAMHGYERATGARGKAIAFRPDPTFAGFTDKGLGLWYAADAEGKSYLVALSASLNHFAVKPLWAFASGTTLTQSPTDFGDLAVTTGTTIIRANAGAGVIDAQITASSLLFTSSGEDAVVFGPPGVVLRDRSMKETASIELSARPTSGTWLNERMVLGYGAAMDNSSGMVLVDVVSKKLVAELASCLITADKGGIAAAIVAGETDGNFRMELVVWDARSGFAEHRYPLDVRLNEQPYLVIDPRAEQLVVGFGGMAGGGQRPPAEATLRVSLKTWKTVPIKKDDWIAVDVYDDVAQLTRRYGKLATNGYSILPIFFSVIQGGFWPPATSSKDGSTVVLLEGKSTKDGEWSDAYALFVDTTSKKVQRRVAAHRDPFGYATVTLSDTGQWLLGCIGDQQQLSVVSRDTTTTYKLDTDCYDVALSPNATTLSISRGRLIKTATGESFDMPWPDATRPETKATPLCLFGFVLASGELCRK